MTIAFKAPLTSSYVNGRLVSRTTDQSASGVIDWVNGTKINGLLLRNLNGVADFNFTSGIKVPIGDTSERPSGAASGLNGIIRYNDQTNKFEGHENGAWTDLVQASGGGGDSYSIGASGMIRLNPQTINENLTLPSGFNGMTAGPVTIASGFNVDIETGARWVIL